MFANGCDLGLTDVVVVDADESGEVARLDLVGVDEHEFADAEPCELFGDHRSQPPDADDADGGGCEPVLAVETERADVAVVALVQRRPVAAIAAR